MTNLCDFFYLAGMAILLASTEYQVLATIERLGESYGMAIWRELLRESFDISGGALYTALTRLEAKGYLSSKWGEPTNIRGGVAKRFYKLTSCGRNSLRATRAHYRT